MGKVQSIREKTIVTFFHVYHQLNELYHNSVKLATVAPGARVAALLESFPRWARFLAFA